MASTFRLRAVIFDIGGVVLRSPFVAIAQYEHELHLPHNYLNCSIAARGVEGAWQRFERGELGLQQFYEEFGRDLSDTENGNIWYANYCQKRGLECPILPSKLSVDGRELFGRMMRDGMEFNDHMVLAIRRIRLNGRYRLIALTNNFSGLLDRAAIPKSELAFLGWQNGPVRPNLRALFDDFCDSSELRMRKPDPTFYLLACERNGVRPDEVVFLDDIQI